MRPSVRLYVRPPTYSPPNDLSIDPSIYPSSIFLSIISPHLPPRQDAYRFKCTLNDFKLYTLYISLSEEDILNLHLP